jgi:hypothetical protein
MKTTTFSLLMAALLLSACARDADVLSKDDKAFLSNRQNKGGDSQSGPGKARLPQKMEVALGILAEGRILQAQQILALAQDLSVKAIDQKNCVQIRPLPSISGKTYRLLYNKCSPGTTAFDASLTGLADLTLQINEKGELTGLKYETRSAEAGKAPSMIVRAFSKTSKDTLLIEESVNLTMARQDGSDQFAVLDSSAQMIMHNGYKDTATTTEVSNFFDGILSTGQISSWHSDMQGQGQNDSAGAGNPVIFSFSLDTPAGKTDSTDFTFRMGKTKRAGKLAFSEKDVKVSSHQDEDLTGDEARNGSEADKDKPARENNKKAPKDDVSTVSRQKSQKIESLPALELWF